MKFRLFSNLKHYQRSWLKSDFVAALVVTAIAIPESLGFAVIVGLPVQAGLYCALVAPVVFAAVTSSKRLVVGADSATAALVASGAATVAAAGTSGYTNAIAVLGLVTAAVLLAMSALRFGFMANLISKPVLAGFISGVGLQLIIGKLPEMLGLHAHGGLIEKLGFLLGHAGQAAWPTAVLAAVIVAVVVAGWKYNYPGALLALGLAIIATKLLGLHHWGIEVVGAVPAGLPSLTLPHLTLNMVMDLIPAAFSIAVVILAQSLAVIRSAAARHEEKVNDNQDLAALGLANAVSAVVGGFAINGSPPRTSAGEMAGGRSQLVNVMMAGLIAVVLLLATGLFEYVPSASLAAVVFTIGLHLLKVRELVDIYRMRRSEFAIAMTAVAGVAVMGVQKGVMIAVILSLVERLRRQYHPHDEILLRDRQYTEWAADRFSQGRHAVEPPPGLLIYRFNEALFFENAGYFLEQATKVVAGAKEPVTTMVIDVSAVTDIDYTAAQTIGRLVSQLNADDIELGLAFVSPRLRRLLNRYGLTELIGEGNLHPSIRRAVEVYRQVHISKAERIAALRLKPDDYVVIGGAVLELMGIRETNDVDLVVSPDVYSRLLDKGWKEFVHDDGKRLLTRQGYRIMLQWMGHDLADLQANAEMVNGIPLMSLPELIDCKTRLGRKKDLADVALIKRTLAASSVSS